jgi:hypothetical protein
MIAFLVFKKANLLRKSLCNFAQLFCRLQSDARLVMPMGMQDKQL